MLYTYEQFEAKVQRDAFFHGDHDAHELLQSLTAMQEAYEAYLEENS
jgi:hypothetical protein